MERKTVIDFTILIVSSFIVGIVYWVTTDWSIPINFKSPDGIALKAYQPLFKQVSWSIVMGLLGGIAVTTVWVFIYSFFQNMSDR